MNYVVQYKQGYFPYDRTAILLNYPENMTWRELQQKFDPTYQHDYLKFWPMGKEIKL